MINLLSNLTVKNFAIIDNINVDFESGFTAITGETGAGKSLLIDAIGLLLGDRASNNMIRNGESKAIIEGIFTNLSVNTKTLLHEYGLDAEDELIIKKEININGKSITRINGSAVSINELENIASTLADIHTQNDTKKLFEPKNYLSFIDNNVSKELLNKYQISRINYINLFKEYHKVLNEIDNYKKDKEYLEYQYQSLVNANLKEGELESLEDEYNVMNNFELIFKNLQSIKNIFDENNINSRIYSISSMLDKISNIDSKYSNMANIVKNSYYELEDIESELTLSLNNLEFDNNYFIEVSERINYLKDLIHKHKKSISELIAYQNELYDKINMLSDSNVLIEDIKKKVDIAFNESKELALYLSQIRKNNAKALVNDIKNSLADLMLDKVQLEIKFDSLFDETMSLNSFPKNGIDVVNILISFNPGETLKDLSKVASGGEMSRVMLAIKTHLLKNLGLSTMIFDEIDSGVSGEVAYQVAKKLKEISGYTQVFSITHLPVVASLADEHLYISKIVEDNMTKTIITKLDNEQRVNVLGKLISPTDETGKSKELAREMLKNI